MTLMIDLLVLILTAVIAVLDFVLLKTIALGVLIIIVGTLFVLISLVGFVCINPNHCLMLVFCGKYIGTIKQNGCV